MTNEWVELIGKKDITAWHGTVQPKGEMIKKFELNTPLAPVISRGYAQRGGQMDELRISSIWFSEDPLVSSRYSYDSADNEQGQVYEVSIAGENVVEIGFTSPKNVKDSLALKPDVLIMSDRDEIAVLNPDIITIVNVTDDQGDYIWDAEDELEDAPLDVSVKQGTIDTPPVIEDRQRDDNSTRLTSVVSSGGFVSQAPAQPPRRSSRQHPFWSRSETHRR